VSSSAYKKALEAAGYLTPSGGAAPGFVTADDGSSATLKRVFADDRIGLKALAYSHTAVFRQVRAHQNRRFWFGKEVLNARASAAAKAD
jgi:hypothetical protein